MTAFRETANRVVRGKLDPKPSGVVEHDRFTDRSRIAAVLLRRRPHFRQDVDQWNFDTDSRNSGYNHNGHRCSTRYARPSD
jgi:hypothetical protein